MRVKSSMGNSKCCFGSRSSTKVRPLQNFLLSADTPLVLRWQIQEKFLKLKSSGLSLEPFDRWNTTNLGVSRSVSKQQAVRYGNECNRVLKSEESFPASSNITTKNLCLLLLSDSHTHSVVIAEEQSGSEKTLYSNTWTVSTVENRMSLEIADCDVFSIAISQINFHSAVVKVKRNQKLRSWTNGCLEYDSHAVFCWWRTWVGTFGLLTCWFDVFGAVLMIVSMWWCVGVHSPYWLQLATETARSC